MKNKYILTRISGVGFTIFLTFFAVVSLQYFSNVLLQESRADVGAMFFWTGLMLILILRVIYWMTESLEAVFRPHGFWERRRG